MVMNNNKNTRWREVSVIWNQTNSTASHGLLPTLAFTCDIENKFEQGSINIPANIDEKCSLKCVGQIIVH